MDIESNLDGRWRYVCYMCIKPLTDWYESTEPYWSIPRQECVCRLIRIENESDSNKDKQKEI